MSDNRMRLLVAADRCDKCRAPAKIALLFKSGELLFCGHCFNENSEALKSADPLISGTDKWLIESMR